MDAALLVDAREERGLALVRSKAKKFRHVAGSVWFAPSQTNDQGYVVDLAKDTCTCPDFEARQDRCKHMWGLMFVRREVAMPDGSIVMTQSVKRISYPQSWAAYNRAQCEEKERVQVLLRGLCDGIEQPKAGRGRPPLPLRDVVYGAALKVYSTVSGRRADTDMRAAESDGLMDKAPSYNSLFRYVERPELMPLLKRLVEQSASPLKAIERSYAVDGTGFSTQTYSRWYDHRYGGEKKTQLWVKAHAMVGTVTNVITAVEATPGNINDSPMFRGLVETTAANGFTMEEVSADKAYLAHDNLAAVEQVGAAPFVPFKLNSSPYGSAAWERMYHLYSLRKEEFSAHYHKRSNVEATFSALKRKFGGSVRSKLLPAQLNEVLLKCLCYNLSVVVHSIHEFGIEPKFWDHREVGR